MKNPFKKTGKRQLAVFDMTPRVSYLGIEAFALGELQEMYRVWTYHRISIYGATAFGRRKQEELVFFRETASILQVCLFGGGNREVKPGSVRIYQFWAYAVVQLALLQAAFKEEGFEVPVLPEAKCHFLINHFKDTPEVRRVVLLDFADLGKCGVHHLANTAWFKELPQYPEAADVLTKLSNSILKD